MDLPAPVPALDNPTRSRLFARLEELRRAASTEELARAVDLHVNGVRRHLDRMHEAGLLERGRSTGGRGRPRDMWTIAPKASPTHEPPEGYGELARWLARAIPAGPTGARRMEKTGREIGREIAPAKEEIASLADGVRQVFTALGFQPKVEAQGEGGLVCSLGNCPYRDSADENPEAICSLHRGITLGILDRLDPAARLSQFEPHDPYEAGCLMEITGAESASTQP